MKKLSLLLATALLAPALVAVSAPEVEAAEIDIGNKILKVADQRASTFRDQSYTANMKIFKQGELRKTLAFDMKMKDLEKQFIVFTEPGDVAGMKILMTDAETIYMYSPEFKKVRRVAAHTQNQGFLGSEMSPEDMAMAKLSTMFDAVLQGKKGNETTLELSPKSEAKTSFSKLEVIIDSSKGGITVIRYFDGNGAQVREQTRSGWTTIKGNPFPTQISMKNLKTGNETVIELSSVDVETPIAESIFQRRTLLRGG